MKQSYRFYRGCYRVARAILAVFYRFSVLGKENVPEGAVMICANHSSVLDPLFIAFALGIENHIHIMAKAELYKVPVLSAIVRKLGTIRVDRGIQDMNAVKETIGYLKKGEKVAIFPEGTRKPVENAVAAKSGAVKLAQYSKAPILPLFIPRKKPLFRRLRIVIGEPFFIEKTGPKRTPEEYLQLAGDLMGKIEALNPDA